jgi:tetratricopeptide (TPR) repeat protein
MFGSKFRARRLNRSALRVLGEGDPAAAQETARRSLALFAARPRSHNTTIGRADALMTLAAIADAGSRHNESAQWLQDAVDQIQFLPASPVRDKWLAELLTRLGTSLRLAGRFAEASTVLTAARGLTHWNGMEPERRAATLTAAGILAKDTGRYTEAAMLYWQAQSVLDSATVLVQTACIHHNMAGLFHVQGIYVEAESEIREALAIRSRTEPPNSDGTAADLSVLGAVLNGQDRLEEAEDAIRAAYQIGQARHGSDHYEVAVQLHSLGSIQHKRHDFDGAADSYRRALQIKERVLGGQHPEIAALLNNIASLEADQGQFIEAKALFGH